MESVLALLTSKESCWLDLLRDLFVEVLCERDCRITGDFEVSDVNVLSVFTERKYFLDGLSDEVSVLIVKVPKCIPVNIRVFQGRYGSAYALRSRW